MDIKKDSWPACNGVNHAGFTTSTFEQKKEELKNRQNQQSNSPDAYKSSCHLPLGAACSVSSWGTSWRNLSGSVAATASCLSALGGPSRRWRSFQRPAGARGASSCSSLPNPLYQKPAANAASVAPPVRASCHPAQPGSPAARLSLQSRTTAAGPCAN